MAQHVLIIRRFIFLLCMVSASSFAFAQKMICVKEKDSGQPIPYANIYMDEAVYYTDKDGALELPNKASTIRISHICYVDTILNLAELKGNDVFISSKTYQIPEITIGKSSHGNRQIGPMWKKEHLYYGGRSGLLLGVFLPYQQEYEGKLINSIVADLYHNKKLVGNYDEIKNAVLRFDLRLPDAQTKAPSSTSLIGGGVIYDSKSGGSITIPLESPIVFPRTGLFVSVEWIVKGECKETVLYNPHIRMSKSKSQSVTWQKRIYRQESWVDWNRDEAMQNLQSSIQAKALNANIGVRIY